MSSQIDVAFVKQFESEVHIAYQRMGSALGNMTRKKTGIVGKSTTFQKSGKGRAGQKSRHGLVPIMNIDKSVVECTLQEDFAADYIDAFDELKIQHDERAVANQTITGAIGRRVDDYILDALSLATTHTIVDGGTGLTETKISQAFVKLGDAEVPADGMRYLPVSPVGWTDLLAFPTFSDADYVGAENLPFGGQGFVAKYYYGFMVFQHTGLVKTGNVRQTYGFHMTAVAQATGADLALEAVWESQRHSTFVKGTMSMGACMIDDLGIVPIAFDETA